MRLEAALKDFSGGLNSKAFANLIEDNELSLAENAVLGQGYVSKRNGYQQFASLAQSVRALYEFVKSDGNSELLCVTDIMLKHNGSSFEGISGTLETSGNVRMITSKNRNMQDRVVIADGGNLKVYTGTTVTPVVEHTPTTEEATSPGLNDLQYLTNFRCMVSHKGRIYAAAHPTVKNRVSFCHIDTTLGGPVYDYFPAVNFFDVASDENDEIMDLKIYRDLLIIFCKRSVWALSGDTTSEFTLTKINVPAGCIAPNSVVEVGNDIFYLSEGHVYALYATDFSFVSAKLMSDKIQRTMEGIPYTEKEKAIGVYFKEKYYLSFPSGVTLVYDVVLGAWVKYTNVQANAFLDYNQQLYFGGNQDKVFVFNDGYNDNGQAIPFKIQTKQLDFGSGIKEKKIKKVYVVSKMYETIGTGYDLDMVFDRRTVRLISNVLPMEHLSKWDEVTFDTGTWDIIPQPDQGSSKWDNAMWDSGTFDFIETKEQKIRANEKGRWLSMAISNDALDQPFTLYSIEFDYMIMSK